MLILSKMRQSRRIFRFSEQMHLVKAIKTYLRYPTNEEYDILSVHFLLLHIESSRSDPPPPPPPPPPPTLFPPTQPTHQTQSQCALITFLSIRMLSNTGLDMVTLFLTLECSKTTKNTYKLTEWKKGRFIAIKTL